MFSRPIVANAGQKYCRMLQGKHSAILSTFFKLPFVIKIFRLSIFEWPFYTGFIVQPYEMFKNLKPVQFCTGFMFCEFPMIVSAK